jgi:drug/metabolite transporter (DMT)-like permease
MSGSPFGYIAWAFLAELPVALFALFRRRRTLTALGQIWRQALAVGVLSVSGYVMVMYAIVYAPMALVSALRETSVIFAAIIGTLIMGERPWQERIVASAAVAGGVALMVAFRA